MTVVFAIRCEDGVVMAADSQITEGDRDFSYPAQKLHPLGGFAAWGGSGARSVLLDAERELERSAEAVLTAEEIGVALQDIMLPIFKRHYERFIPAVPGEGEKRSASPAAYLLAGGYAQGQPFIVEINPHGMVGRYEDIGFHAIGSGAPLAQQAGALLAHFRMMERDVRYGVAAAVRVLDALKLTSPSVGGPIAVSRMTADGAEHLADEQIAQARADVSRWEKTEKEGLDALFK